MAGTGLGGIDTAGGVARTGAGAALVTSSSQESMFIPLFDTDQLIY